MIASLKEIEVLVDALNPEDQARLLQYLASRRPSTQTASPTTATAADAAWLEFRRVGEILASSSNGKSITEAVSEMRR